MVLEPVLLEIHFEKTIVSLAISHLSQNTVKFLVQRLILLVKVDYSLLPCLVLFDYVVDGFPWLDCRLPPKVKYILAG